MKRLIDKDDLLDKISLLKKSPWFKKGENIDEMITGQEHASFLERKEAVEIVEMCVCEAPVALFVEELKFRLSEARLVDVDDPYSVVCGIIDEMVGSEGGTDE